MTDRDELIEAMARAAYIAHHKNGPTDEALEFPNMGRGGFKTEVGVWRAVAQAALDAHDKALAEAGMVVVPREPSEAMIDMGHWKIDPAIGAWTVPAIKGLVDQCYRAMIAAHEGGE